MQELMNGAELKSLVTQLQCSYADVLNLTIDAVVERSSRCGVDGAGAAGAEGEGAAGREDNATATGRGDTGEAGVSTEDANGHPTEVLMTAKERKTAAALRDIAAAGDAGKPLRLMFSSLDGKLKETLGKNEAGLYKWCCVLRTTTYFS
jgi:hypothetical protein